MRTVLTVLVTALAATAAAVAVGLNAGPGPLPTVVGITVDKDVTPAGSGTGLSCGCPSGTTNVRDFRVFRTWSDGYLDAVHVTFNSGGVTSVTVDMILPGLEVFADVDRDGLVGITDFLNVLGNWTSIGGES